ncbi:hypothetical protein ABTD95_19650, partial [Acinetobacter baumannii]
TVVTTSANGLSVTTQRDTTGSRTFNQVRTDVIVLNADGSRTETISDFNGDGSLRDRTVGTVSASGLNRTAQTDVNGDGVVDSSQTD